MDRLWIYKARRTDAYFCGELNKFIQTAENHVRNKKTQRIPYPCKTCKNMRLFSNTTTIRSHELVGGFLENYTLLTYYDEKAQPPTENPLNEIIQDAECRCFVPPTSEFVFARLVRVVCKEGTKVYTGSGKMSLRPIAIAII
jgi:hypothetical protein